MRINHRYYGEKNEIKNILVFKLSEDYYVNHLVIYDQKEKRDYLIGVWRVKRKAK